MRTLSTMVCVSFLACASDGSRATRQLPTERMAQTVAPSAATGFVLMPDQGEKLFFCRAPELSVTLKSKSVPIAGVAVALGTAEIAHGSNTGVHQDEDEIVFIHSGNGSVVLGERTIPAPPGTIMYVPRGTRHGFVNNGNAPFEFFWMVAPPGLAERFLATGKSSLKDCATP